MTRNAFRADTNGFQPTLHIPRPTAHQDIFRDLSSEALAIAQRDWDEADLARINHEAMKKRAQEYDESEEGKAAREQMRQMYTG